MVVMVMEAMVMEKDLLRQSQVMDMLPATHTEVHRDFLAIDMEDMGMEGMVMEVMATEVMGMAKDLLKQSLDMDTMVMDMDMGMAMDMDMATMDTMARDLPRPSLDMDTTVMDMDTGTAMAMVMDTMDKQTLDLEFSTNEVGLKFSLVKSTLFSCLNKS